MSDKNIIIRLLTNYSFHFDDQYFKNTNCNKHKINDGRANMEKKITKSNFLWNVACGEENNFDGNELLIIALMEEW